MPVLEAMACGLPVIVTGGGPTDEFCPPEAGWRIRSDARRVPRRSASTISRRPAAHGCSSPTPAHLVELLRAAGGRPGRARRRPGRAGRAAAQPVVGCASPRATRERIAALAARRPRSPAAPTRAVPARTRTSLCGCWRRRPGAARIASASCSPSGAATTTRDHERLPVPARRPGRRRHARQLEARVLAAAAAAGADLDAGADINVLMEPMRRRPRRAPARGGRRLRAAARRPATGTRDWPPRPETRSWRSGPGSLPRSPPATSRRSPSAERRRAQRVAGTGSRRRNAAPQAAVPQAARTAADRARRASGEASQPRARMTSPMAAG